MPSGGYRPGAGRPKGSVKKKHQITVADVGRAEYLPIEYMLALMRDERAEPHRRDAMATQAAPYLHARLNAVATSNYNGDDSCGDVNTLQIFSVPRGGRLDPKTGTIVVDGELVKEPPTVAPFEGTPPLISDQSEQSQPAP